jgi:hypothetical protein
MPRKRTSRLRARKQGGATPYDGDFRDYTVVGGGIEALKPAGSNWATTDPDVANRLITQRLQQLEKSKRSLDVLGLRETGFTESLAHHADPKAQTTEATCQWLEAVEGYLHAGATSGARAPGPTSDSEPQREYSNSLSNLFRRAESEGCVPPELASHRRT